jgi:hypothetical protein
MLSLQFRYRNFILCEPLRVLSENKCTSRIVLRASDFSWPQATYNFKHMYIAQLSCVLYFGSGVQFAQAKFFYAVMSRPSWETFFSADVKVHILAAHEYAPECHGPSYNIIWHYRSAVPVSYTEVMAPDLWRSETSEIIIYVGASKHLPLTGAIKPPALSHCIYIDVI